MLASLTTQLGLVLMTAATTFSMLELPDHAKAQVIVPSRAVFAFANENTDQNNQLKRESEETGPHYISYAESQRTPSRSGRH